VTPKFIPGAQSSWTWTSLEDFEAGIEYLKRHYTILSLEEAWERLARRSLRGPCAAITIDDGDISDAQYCVPLLEKRGIPATFFINSSSLAGNGHYWFTILTHLRSRPMRSPKATL